MNKQILMPEKLRQQFRDEFKVKRHTFNGYLCYRTNSPAARIMRKTAIEHGAILFTGYNGKHGKIDPFSTA